jgi:hypothetical protein
MSVKRYCENTEEMGRERNGMSKEMEAGGRRHGRSGRVAGAAALIALCAWSVPATAQTANWTLGSASSAYYTAGNVGIGTTAPTAPAHVLNNDSTGAPTLLLENLGNAAGNFHLASHRPSAGNAGIFRFKYYDSAANYVEAGWVAGTILDINSASRAGAIVFATQSAGAALATEKMRVDGAGNVGIGTAAPTAKLHVVGNATFTGAVTGGSIQATYQDIAEWVPSTRKLMAGTVVALDPSRTNAVVASSEAYDTRVAGVISDAPGLLLGVEGEGKVRVATTGRVKLRVHSEKAVKVGDLLVTSGEEGVAMVSEPIEVAGVKIHRPGTLIGKALEPMQPGSGEILALLSLQ